MATPLERAIAVVGSLSDLAKAISVSPQVVSNWQKRGIPANRVLDIERATNGVVSRHELRSDIFGASA